MKLNLSSRDEGTSSVPVWYLYFLLPLCSVSSATGPYHPVGIDNRQSREMPIACISLCASGLLRQGLTVYAWLVWKSGNLIWFSKVLSLQAWATILNYRIDSVVSMYRGAVQSLRFEDFVLWEWVIISEPQEVEIICTSFLKDHFSSNGWRRLGNDSFSENALLKDAFWWYLGKHFNFIWSFLLF